MSHMGHYNMKNKLLFPLPYSLMKICLIICNELFVWYRVDLRAFNKIHFVFTLPSVPVLPSTSHVAYYERVHQQVKKEITIRAHM